MGDLIIKDVFIYPNPTNHSISINTAFAESSVAIFDLKGEQVINIQNYVNGEKIDVSGLPKGVYLIRIVGVNDSKSYSGKFVKE